MATTVWTDVTQTRDVNYMSVCGGGRRCSPPISADVSNNTENTCFHKPFKIQSISQKRWRGNLKSLIYSIENFPTFKLITISKIPNGKRKRY